MSRELRRVPVDWVHPTDRRGPIPTFDQSLADAVREWKEGYAKWEAGDDPCRDKYGGEWWEWEGDPPKPASEGGAYRDRAWAEDEATYFQMYETCSEGTPISPVLATPELVARWCADNGASMFGYDTATYEQWMSVCSGTAGGLLVIDRSAGTMTHDAAWAEGKEPTE